MQDNTEGMKISGLLFWVQENKLSEKFYKKLGFTVIHSEDQYSVAELGSFQITLLNMRDEEKFSKDAMAAEKGRGMYAYIRVDDVDGEFDKLRDAGIKPATEPKDWPWGNCEFIVKDPDGYKLCFWQPIRSE